MYAPSPPHIPIAGLAVNPVVENLYSMEGFINLYRYFAIFSCLAFYFWTFMLPRWAKMWLRRVWNLFRFLKILTILNFISGFIISINSVSVSASSFLQSILTVAKLIGLAVLILTGAVLLFQGNAEHFRNPFALRDLNPGLLPGAFYSGIFAYAGW